jgi:succinate dehydrogenase / fumarate reductase, cytochrome b subunit
MSLMQAFQSTIGKKLVMGFTGLFLISFLIIHATINGMIFFNDGGKMFNEWAGFMSHNYIVRFLELGLFVGFILHIIQGFSLTLKNQKTRNSKYAVSPGNSTSKWYSRSMGILGSLLLIFLVVHLSQFWFGTKVSLYAHNDAEHNLYNEMQNAFTKEWIVITYLIGVIALAWHLVHGFPSAFQTLGLNNPKYNGLIKTIGLGFSIVVPLLFALMPLAFYFNWIG